MASDISGNYRQFYRGTEQIPGYGSGTGRKDTVVHYEFRTTDEKGNKVMDKMTKEETFRTMNEISSQYGDHVIVEFSGDALTALERHGKGLLNQPAPDKEPVPVEYLEGPHALTQEELAAVKGSYTGDDMPAIMREVDPDAYREYQRISREGAAEGTREGMTAGFRYEVDWIKKKAAENPKWLEEYKAAPKTEADTGVRNQKSELSEKAAAFLDKLRKAYGDYDFIVGNAGDDLRSLVQNSGKEFSVVFTTQELEKMASDEKYAEEKMNAVKGAVRMSRQINAQFGFETASDNSLGNGVKMSTFGIRFHEDGSVSYFAELEKSPARQKDRMEQLKEKRAQEKKETAKSQKAEAQKDAVHTRKVLVEAPSVEELIDKIKQVDWSEAKAGKQVISDRQFDYSV